MPTYSYHCSNCNIDHEAFQKITEEPLKTCPKCGQNTLKRGPGGGIGLAFKGSGFYINDYAPQPPADKPSGGGGCCPCGKKPNSCGDTGSKES